MLFKNWFSSKKVDVADLESVSLTPEVILPEPTRRDLYNAAVSEVQHLRVKELILRELNEMSIDPQVKEQTLAAQEEYGTKDLDMLELIKVKESHPLAHLDMHKYCERIRLPEPSLEALAKILATQYLSTELSYAK